MSNISGCLTKYPAGSIRELCTIAVPLMLSILSGNLMMFADRLILSHLSLAAMNAAAAASMVCMVIQYGAIGIASIAEVFVGQYNGSHNHNMVAQPTWQMLWFALFSAVPFYFIAQFLGPYVLTDYHYHDFGLPFFKWLLYFGPTFPAQVAISAFFIGLGKVRLVTIAAVVGNMINIGLDIILIFGITNYVPALGAKGAAMATGIAQCIQLLILIIPFLSTYNRSQYHTYDYGFKPKLLWQYLKIGVPSAAGHMIEISAWAIIARILVSAGEIYITVFAVGQSFLALIAFGMEGLQKSVTTIAANFIGAKMWDNVVKIRWSAIKMLLILAGIFAGILIVYPDPIINEFITKNAATDKVQLFNALKLSCFFVWSYFIFDGLTWISAGVLIAAGDTTSVMIIHIISNWFFALAPMYVFIILLHGAPMQIWLIANSYGLINAILFYLRYRQGKWRNIMVQ